MVSYAAVIGSASSNLRGQSPDSQALSAQMLTNMCVL